MTTAIISAVSIVALIVWELNRKDPIVNLRLLGNRNFAVTILFMTTTGAVLFGTPRSSLRCCSRCSATTPPTPGWRSPPAASPR